MGALEIFSSRIRRGICYSLGFFVLALSLSALAQTTTLPETLPEPAYTVVIEGYYDGEITGWRRGLFEKPIRIVVKKGAYITNTDPPQGPYNQVPHAVVLQSNSSFLNENGATIYTEGFLSQALSFYGHDNYGVNRGELISRNKYGINVLYWGNNNTFINAKEGVIRGLDGNVTIAGNGHNNKFVIYGTVVAEAPEPGRTGEVDAIALGGVRDPYRSRNRIPAPHSNGNHAEIYGNAYAFGEWAQSLVVWEGDNQYFNIHEGARLLGYVSNHAYYNTFYENGFNAFGSNNGLNIDQGAAMSYVYQYLGKWDYINDLDGRPVVEGNEVIGDVVPAYNIYMIDYTPSASGDIMAAGIGGLEVADEGQFSRVTMVNNALLNQDYQRKNARRRLRNRHYNALKGRFHPWAQATSAISSREADPSDPTLLGYEEKSYGVIAGLPMQAYGKNFDFIVNVGQGNVDIEDGVHTITSMDARVGIYLPRFFKFRLGRHKAEISGKTLVGYSRREVERDVLTNVNTTPGIVKYEGTSNVFDVQVGASAETEIRLGSRTSASFRLGLDIAYDLVTAYSEKENGQWFSSEYADKVSFDWETRHLVQGIVTASTGVQYRAARRLNTYGVASVTARQVLMGKEAKYTLGGVGVSFEGDNSAGITAELNLGATYGLTRKIRIGASAQTRAGSDGVTGYSAGAFMDWRFGR